MTDEIATANAEADTNSVDNTNISVADLANRRLGQMQAQAQPQEEGTQEVSEEIEEAAEEVTEETVEGNSRGNRGDNRGNSPKTFFHSWTWTICPRRS